MKKLIALLLALVLVFGLCACGSNGGSKSDSKKIGIILVGDENEGYTYAHIEGVRQAMEELGIEEDQVIWKYNVEENEACADAAEDLVDSGCGLIISNSYSHQSFMQQVAADNPDVTFIADTGDTAAISGLDNFKNAFTGVYQSRYVSGVVAGMKVQELVENGELSDENYEDGLVKIGYVGAYPYAEVVSGFTAFFLGIQSVYPDVTMEVTYTNSWFDLTAENEAAKSLIADGCVIIGQHADSTGAPTAVQEALTSGKVCYSVGYNVDMLSVAPEAALTSASNVWGVFYKYAFNAFLNDEEIVTDWCEGYETGAVKITDLGPACADGTAEKVEEVIAGLKDGSINVFDTSTFTVNGEHLDSCMIDLTGDFDTDDEGDQDAIWDGCFHESYFRSAPSFSVIIDGITELN